MGIIVVLLLEVPFRLVLEAVRSEPCHDCFGGIRRGGRELCDDVFYEDKKRFVVRCVGCKSWLATLDFTNNRIGKGVECPCFDRFAASFGYAL